MTGGSLRLRLFVAGSLSIVAALALAGFGLTLLFERHVERRVVAELNLYLDQVVAGIDRGADGSLAVSRTLPDPRFTQPLSGAYWQVNATGATLRSRSLWDTSLDLPANAAGDATTHEHRVSGPGGDELLVVERSVSLPARLGGTTARAAVAVDMAEIRSATSAFAKDLTPYLVVLAVFLIAAAYAQVSVGLRPLAAVRTRLAAIRAGKSERVGQDLPQEIRPLAQEVDALLDARDQQIARARARAADLAHGFKTPLQVLAGDAQRLRERGETALAAAIEEVAGTMRRHVDRELARARSAVAMGSGRADVADTIGRVVGVVRRTAAGERLTWTTDAASGLIAAIDADDLAEALGNLVENAARHAHSIVDVSAKRHGGRIAITVSDDGPGIPEARLAEAMSRGGRMDTAGDGAGLGLAIVRDIADAWGGNLGLVNRQVGLAAELSLPPFIP